MSHHKGISCGLKIDRRDTSRHYDNAITEILRDGCDTVISQDDIIGTEDNRRYTCGYRFECRETVVSQRDVLGRRHITRR